MKCTALALVCVLATQCFCCRGSYEEDCEEFCGISDLIGRLPISMLCGGLTWLLHTKFVWILFVVCLIVNCFGFVQNQSSRTQHILSLVV